MTEAEAIVRGAQLIENGLVFMGLEIAIAIIVSSVITYRR